MREWLEWKSVIQTGTRRLPSPLPTTPSTPQAFLSSLKMHCTHFAIAFTTCLLAGFLREASCSLPPEHDFSQVHSYPSNTSFDAHDGWKRVTITDLSYKYPNQSISPVQQAAGLASHHRSRRSTLENALDRRAGKSKTASKKPKKKPQPKKTSKSTSKAKSSTDIINRANVGGLLNQAIKGIGKTTSVVITWYTLLD
jgi:hypothetical protein